MRPFWTGYLLSISLCMDLGIVNVATIRVALTQGGTTGGNRGALLPFAAGFAAAGLTWAAVIAYGAGALRGSLGKPLTRALALVSAIVFLYLAAVVFVRGLRAI